MKKVIVATVIGLLFISNSSVFAKNCKKELTEQEIRKQKLTCFYKGYYSDGKLKKRGNFKNGLAVGIWELGFGYYNNEGELQSDEYRQEILRLSNLKKYISKNHEKYVRREKLWDSAEIEIAYDKNNDVLLFTVSPKDIAASFYYVSKKYIWKFKNSIKKFNKWDVEEKKINKNVSLTSLPVVVGEAFESTWWTDEIIIWDENVNISVLPVDEFIEIIAAPTKGKNQFGLKFPKPTNAIYFENLEINEILNALPKD